jgi:hypothetical protein
VQPDQADQVIQADLVCMDEPFEFTDTGRDKLVAVKEGLDRLGCFDDRQRDALLTPHLWGPKYVLLRVVVFILREKVRSGELLEERFLGICEEVECLWGKWAGWIWSDSDNDVKDSESGGDDDDYLDYDVEVTCMDWVDY